MYQEFLVYFLAVVVVIFSIAQGGYLLSMIAVIGMFYFMDVTRFGNSAAGKRTLIVTVVTAAILVVSMFTLI